MANQTRTVFCGPLKDLINNFLLQWIKIYLVYIKLMGKDL